jgi:plasmid stabilization system protein ParE
MKMKVQFVQSAHSDFANILSYYQEQGAPEQGRRLIAEIIKKSERLAKYPDSGGVVPEFGMTFLREIIYPPFRVVYRRDTHQISVVRVWRSERLLNDNDILTMEIQENRATYGKRKRLAGESKKLNRKEEQALVDVGLRKKKGPGWSSPDLMDNLV